MMERPETFSKVFISRHSPTNHHQTLRTANVLIGSVVAVGLAVAEERLGDAGAVSAGQLVLCGAERLIGVDARQHQLGPLRLVTVAHCVLPITRLLVQVERQTVRTLDLLQTLRNERDNALVRGIRNHLLMLCILFRCE